MEIDASEMTGAFPMGAERENRKAKCPHCLHHPMKERDYMNIATAQETTIQTCPRCGTLVQVG